MTDCWLGREQKCLSMRRFLTLYMTVNWHREFAVNFATFLKVCQDFFTFAPWFSSSPTHNISNFESQYKFKNFSPDWEVNLSRVSSSMFLNSPQYMSFGYKNKLTEHYLKMQILYKTPNSVSINSYQKEQTSEQHLLHHLLFQFLFFLLHLTFT